MKYIVILIFLIISACSPSNNSCNIKSQIEYEEIYCPKCNGIGEVKADAGTRVIMGIMTLGPGALIETIQCDMCNGTGIVKRRKLNN